MGIFDTVNIFKIKKENEDLKSLLESMGAGEAITIKKNIDNLQNEEKTIALKKDGLQREVINLDSVILQKKSEILVLDEELMLEDFALYVPKFEFVTSEEYRERLEIIREKQKQLIKSGLAASGSQTWTVNNSKAQGKKIVSDMVKLVLRSFNNECDYCVDNVKFNNIDRSVKRIEQSYESLRKLGSLMQVFVTEEYKQSKLEELYLAYEYQQKKQEEKEEQKRIREELREQQKLEQEIRAAREKIQKERNHFSKALKEFESKLLTATAEDKEALNSKVEEIKAQLDSLDSEEKVIDYREKNAKAGYIYVISNIGAFGEGVYKIGMTRRLEPLDRINELGDASVPFNFDVHALVFSDNAPDLEAKIHQHFHATRVNKLNQRREFFRADIEEIEKIIRENYDKTVDIVKYAPAEQYRESLLIGS